MTEAPLQQTQDSEYWIFGYGSLIWKPPPVYERRIPGFIKGHVRRFWQLSTDHRGTVENPGRVVTLIPHQEWKSMDDYHQNHEEDVTWGVAYKIADKDVEAVRAYLDFRERNGYTSHAINVYQKDRAEPVVRDAVVYIATTCNDAYCGPAPLEHIAQQVYHSHGLSGPNRDYLLNLAHALRIIAPDSQDNHLFDLERKVLELCALYGGSTPASKIKGTAALVRDGDEITKSTTTPSSSATTISSSSTRMSANAPLNAGIMELTSFSSLPKNLRDVVFAKYPSFTSEPAARLSVKSKL